ncbi:MAG: LysR family transcriptional regulator [Rhodospirillaceae bacterium]|nr:LysR family transcriptional regulator [Rhodospirillaceae bacterium]
MSIIHEMDITELDLNLLLVFQTIHREQNVTRAAARLGLSQPAVSSALARLRRILGDPLFVRSRQGMQPTMRARQLLQPIDQGLGLISQGLQQHTGFDPKRSEASLTLLVSDIGEIVYLPPLVNRIRSLAPGMRLRVRQLSQNRYAEALESGAADLAIGFIASLRSSYRYRRLFSDHFVCIARSDRPGLGNTIRAQQFLEAEHVVMSRAGDFDSVVTKALARLGYRLKIAVSVPHFHAIPAIVARTDLVAVVPHALARLAGESSPIKIVPLPFHIPSLQVGLHWHARCHDDPANRWLRKVMIELLRGGPAHASLRPRRETKAARG